MQASDELVSDQGSPNSQRTSQYKEHYKIVDGNISKWSEIIKVYERRKDGTRQFSYSYVKISDEIKINVEKMINIYMKNQTYIYNNYI